MSKTWTLRRRACVVEEDKVIDGMFRQYYKDKSAHLSGSGVSDVTCECGNDQWTMSHWEAGNLWCDVCGSLIA